jgi:hypothetical protein
MRRRLHVEERPFTPLPYYPRHATRKRALAAEIRAIEAQLVGHLRHDVCNVLEKRNERIARNDRL